MRDIVEIYLYWQAGEGVRRIARSLGLDRSTVKKHISPALEAGFKLGELRTRSDPFLGASRKLPSRYA